MSIFQRMKLTGKSAANNLEHELQRKIGGSNGSDYDPTEPPGFNVGSYALGSQPPKKKTKDYLQSATGWVYASVSAIADGVSSVEIKLYQKKGEDIEEVTDHPAISILQTVNNYTTKLDHFWLTQQYLELAGEAPWFVDRGPNGKGEPTSILLLRPDLLDVLPEKDPKSPEIVREYHYRLDDGGKTVIPVNNMILIKYPDPVNMFRGKGTLQAAATAVDVDQYSEEWNRRFFFNSARPDSILKTEQKLNERQRKTLKAQVDQMYRGVQNAHLVAILESGLDWKPMQLMQKDMEFLEQQRFSRDKILTIFRVPKPIVGISEDVNLANATVGEYVFAKWTVVPKMKKLVAQLNEFLLPMFSGTEDMFYSFEDPVPENNQQNITKYESALSKGWMTINEVRAEQGLSAAGPDADRLLIPSGIRPLDQIDIPETPAFFSVSGSEGKSSIEKRKMRGVIERSAGGYNLARRRLEIKSMLEEKQNKVNEIIASAVSEMAKQMVSGKLKGTKQKVEKVTREQVTEKALALYDRNERSIANVVAGLFRSQLARVLDKLPQERAGLATDEKAAVNVDKIFDENEENQLFVRVLTPQVARVVREGGEGGEEAIGLAGNSFDDQTKPVQSFIQKRTVRFSTQVNRETMQLLKDQLTLGVQAGESIPDIRARVQGVFSGMEKYRAERIARSEVIRASNFGAQQAWKQSGIVTRQEWHVTNDDRTCEFCPQLDGKKIPLGASYKEKGSVVVGAEDGILDLDYETVERPPLHPNCRCVLLPVIENVEPKPEDFGAKLTLDQGIPESEVDTYSQAVNDGIGRIETRTPGLMKDYGKGLKINISNAQKASPLKGMQVAGDYENGRIRLFAPAGTTAEEFQYLTKKLSDSVYHEIGHHVQARMKKVNPDGFQQVVEFMASPAVLSGDKSVGPIKTNLSYYATKNTQEYFAEGFREFMQSPGKLKSRDLKMFTLMEGLFSKYKR